MTYVQVAIICRNAHYEALSILFFNVNITAN